MQDLIQSPFESKCRQISLPPASKGIPRVYKCAATAISPSLSMICSCEYILWLDTASLPSPLPLGLATIPCQLDFRSPSLFFLAYPPILALKSITTLSPPFSEYPQTPLGPPTPHPLWRSCFRSVKTPEHVFGFGPSNPPQREDSSQRPCRIAA